jgi:hypothetical protein
LLLTSLLAGLAFGTQAFGQSDIMKLPQSIAAGGAFSIPTTGNGKAVLYIVGPGHALRRDVQLGETLPFPAGALYNAGRYLVILVAGSSTDTGELDVMPVEKPETLSFLAEPSRLPIGLHDGISGTIYVFDSYHNLISAPMPASFELSNSAGAVQAQNVTTRNGVAWTRMNSAAKEGAAQLTARVDGVSSTRVIEVVPGDPCRLTMTARADRDHVELQTAPVRDCSGNPVPDGTIVTFTETLNGMQSTVDVPLKQGIARVEMPAWSGARISVASGVVAGNQIRWEGGR